MDNFRREIIEDKWFNKDGSDISSDVHSLEPIAYVLRATYKLEKVEKVVNVTNNINGKRGSEKMNKISNLKSVYVVLESDGDMGYVLDKVFSTETIAKKYLLTKTDAYNYHIEKMDVITHSQ